MSIWYMARDYGDYIIEVEVISTTAKQITYMDTWIGRRHESKSAKISDTKAFFETFEEAKAHLLSKKDKEIENAKRILHRLQSDRGQILSIKEASKKVTK